jgi:acyl carrier protein
LAPGADLRDTFELDSLDFVELMDRLSTRAGFRIEEVASINFLVAQTSS